MILPLSVLGMGGFGWVPLTLARTLIPDMDSILSSVYASVVSALSILAAAVIIEVPVSQMTSLSMTSASAPLVIPLGLSQVVVLSSAAVYLSLTSVISHSIPRPAVADETYVIHSDLSS